MKDFYINAIEEKKKQHVDIYQKVLRGTFGKVLSWEELKEQNSDMLIDIMCTLDKEIKIRLSPYDVKKLTRAIQHSRGGAGFCAITKFTCAFCGKEETWGSTAVPKICQTCAESMAINLIMSNMDIMKSQ